jgi:hypothetical protein
LNSTLSAIGLHTPKLGFDIKHYFHKQEIKIEVISSVRVYTRISGN